MNDLKLDIATIKESQIRMEEDIRHHIKRTDLLEELHKDNARRIELLEEPIKAQTYLKNKIILWGKVSGAVLSIIAAITLLYRK